MENKSTYGSTKSLNICLDLARVIKWTDASILSTFIILGIIDVLVIGGNTLVVLAFFLHSKLRSVTSNLFIISLAVADLLLGMVVLPFSTLNEIFHFWLFGEVWCKMWLAVDVWLCTASILNLCVISLDRYLAVTRPVRYLSLMSSRRAKVLIACVWCISFLICLPPLIGWNDARTLLASKPTTHEQLPLFTNHVLVNMTANEEPLHQLLNVTEMPWVNGSFVGHKERDSDNARFDESLAQNLSRGCQCQLILNKGYRIYSALGSFYLPMSFMVFFYWRIYHAVVETTRAINQGFKTTTMGESFNKQKLILRIHRGRSPGGLYGIKTNGVCTSQQSFPQNHYNHSSSGNSSSHLKSSPVLPSKPKKFNSSKRFKGGIRINFKFPSLSERKICAMKNMKRKEVVSDNGSCVCKSAKHQWLTIDLETMGRTSSAPTSQSNVEREVTSKNNNFKMENNGDQKTVVATSQAPVFQCLGERNIKTEIKRFRMETKAAKTLGIIVGGFILCWLPFSIIYLAGAFCDKDSIYESLFSVFVWLGYCNSAINPCIYAFFCRDFRYAFKKILCRCVLSGEISIKQKISVLTESTP